ncbi:MAG: exodeoxyribonuclease VII large subunit, partial [candidate division WOR-3 bacterium]
GALNALSPLASLARGYCICQKVDGRVVKSIGQVMVDEGVFVRLSDGKIKCDVREKMGGENGQ